MPRGKGYGPTFQETFGSQDDQPYNSTSSFNMWDMSKKAKKAAAYLRKTNLGNAAFGGRPFGKFDTMRDGSTPKKVRAGQVLVTSVVRGDGIGHVGSPSKAGARKALRD